MARNYAALYYEYQDEMAYLSDEEFGRLMRALIAYSRDGTPVPEDGNLKFFAVRVMNREDETKSNYDEVAERNRQNARKRWAARDARRCDRMPDDATRCDSMPTGMPDDATRCDSMRPAYQKCDSNSNSKSESESQSQSERESKEDARAREAALPAAPAAENPDAGLLGAFEAFWHLYPRKMGKDAARAEWLKIRPAYETQVRICDAVREQSKSRQWTQEGGRFIPAPAKWLSEGRWQDDSGGSTTIQDVMDQMEDW